MSDEVPGAVVKVIELVGSSRSSFSDAVRNAVRTASRTIRGIRGVDVLSSSASVDPSGEIALYKVDCKIAFVVERPEEEGGEDLAEMASREPGMPPYVESGGPDLEK